MVLTLPLVSHKQALELLEKAHIDMLWQTFLTYRQLHIPYPTLRLPYLKPPYGKITSEHPYFPCHINVLFWENYQLRKHDQHFPIKHRLSLDMARQIGGAQSSRFLGAKGFPTLYKSIASGSEDGATLITLDRKHNHPKLTHHQTHINVNAAHALKKLTPHLAEQGIKHRLRDGAKQYHLFRRQLADKLYEHVAWPNTGGQKHLAASCLHLNMDAPGLVIDVLSKSGVYTRLQSDENKNPVIHHITLQRLEDLKPSISLPSEYILENDHIFVKFTYRRIDTYDLEQPWLQITEQALVSFENPQETIPIKILL
ncbi:MAG: hypothetical protein AABX70_04510 [Nanoarchaeota archaeon]